jgi:hypothetical protein
MSKMKSNTVSHAAFLSEYLKTVWSRVPLVKLSALLASVILISSLGVATQAQTATATPESEEIIRLREQKTRAELEKDIAVAEKGKFDAQFPKPSTSPLAGETKINDTALIESDMVSYVSMAHAANDIVKALRASNARVRNLAIYSKPDIDLLLNYNVTTNQIELLRQHYCKLLKQDPRCRVMMEDILADESGSAKRMLDGQKSGFLGAVPIAGSILGAFVDMTALLRTNVTVQGHGLDINESALVSEVFRAIRAKDGLNPRPNLYYPAAFAPNINLNTTSPILGEIEVLFELKARTSALMQALDDNSKKTRKVTGKLEELDARITEIKGQQKKCQDELNVLLQTQRVYGRRTPFEAHQRIQELRNLQADSNKNLYQTQKEFDAKTAELKLLEAKGAALLNQLASDLQTADVDETVAKLKGLNERFDQFVANLTKIDNATGINSLTAYIKAENLSQALNGPDGGDAYWLQLAVVKAGGNNRIKTNLVADIFTGGSRISHSGGVIVQYNLYDLNGRSVVSDTLTQYAGYVKSGKIQRLPNPSAIDDVQEDATEGAKQKQAPRKAIASGSRS